MKKYDTEERLFEYRILYNASKSLIAMDSYHYYMAASAQEAFDFHDSAMKYKKFCSQNLKVERFDPYADRWQDESDLCKLKHFNYCNE